MIKSKNSFLQELAKKPELKNNIISIVFAMHPEIDISKREKFYDNVISYFQRYSENDRLNFPSLISEGETVIEEWTGRDFRIKSVKIKSVRGFPFSNKPFGINFKDTNDNPQSMILLGANGSGKSSLYNAIEYSYCKRIGEAQLRTSEEFIDEDEKFKTYLQNFNNGFQNSFCEIESVDEKFTLQGLNIPVEVRRRINPDTHFISDFDIYSKGQLNYQKGGNDSFHNIIAESLGLNELLVFEKFLKSFSLYSRATESRQVSSLEKSILSEQTLIENNTKAIVGLKERIILLEESQKALPPEQSLKESISLINQIKTTTFDFSITTSKPLQELISDFYKNLTKVSSLSAITGSYLELQFLNLGLVLVKDKDDCPFCQATKKSKDEIINEVNQRIENLNQLDASLLVLSKSFDRVTEYLNNLNNNISLLNERVIKEHALIKGNTELNKLFSIEIQLIEYLSLDQTNDFFSKLNRLSEDQNYLKDKFNYFSDFLRKNSDVLIPALSILFEKVSYFQNERKSIILEVEKTVLSKAQNQTLLEQIITAKNEISIFEKQITGSTENINRNNIELSKFREILSSYDKIKKQTIEYVSVYHIYLNKEVEQAFLPIQMIVEEVLNGYLTRENRNVKLEITKDSEEIDAETGEVLSEIITAKIIVNGEKDSSIPVNRFFNTFHYRLFSTMIGIGIAVASRLNTRINLPVVLDDIFYASDFENRARVESFIHEIFEIFHTYTPDIPLQLILFTHDQLIFESAIKASSKSKIHDVIFAKLFHFSDSTEEDSFLNLIYKFQTYLPQSLVKNSLSIV